MSLINGVIENFISYMYFTKFQKLGLSHVDMLLILDNNDKLCESKDYDNIVKA